MSDKKALSFKKLSTDNNNNKENDDLKTRKIQANFDEAMRNPLLMQQTLMGMIPERNLGDGAYIDGKYKKALKHYQTALQSGERGFGEDSFQIMECLVGLCETYIALKDWANAEKYANRLMRIGVDHECEDTIQNATDFLDMVKRKDSKSIPNEVDLKDLKIDDSTDPNKPAVIPVCASCNALNAKFRCSSCKVVNYCSRECQISDWRSHKSQCSTMKVTPSAPRDPSKPSCGLCGSQGTRITKIIKTECCNNWICGDQQSYELSSFKLNSCQRNHYRYTLCHSHFDEKHRGKFTDCHKCEPLYWCTHADTEEESVWKKFVFKHFYFENVGEKEMKRNRELKRDGTKACLVTIPFNR